MTAERESGGRLFLVRFLFFLGIVSLSIKLGSWGGFGHASEIGRAFNLQYCTQIVPEMAMDLSHNIVRRLRSRLTF